MLSKKLVGLLLITVTSHSFANWFDYMPSEQKRIKEQQERYYQQTKGSWFDPTKQNQNQNQNRNVQQSNAAKKAQEARDLAEAERAQREALAEIEESME